MIGRRDFLKNVATGAALGPAFIPGRALGRDGVVAPSDRITVACIGTGWQGGNNVDSFLEEPGAQVVAACDIDAGHLETARQVAACDIDAGHLETARQAINKKYGNQDCKTYHEFEEVLARKDIDAVMLAVPDHWHGVLSTAAVAAGKDIYGEKPLAQNFAEGRAICEAVERYQCVWQTGSWQRSRDDFRRACELVINGRIGKISRVKVVLPGGLTDFDGLGDQDSPVPPPSSLDYKRWLGPAPEAPYCPARVHKTWQKLPTARRAFTRPGVGIWTTAAAC